MKKILFITTGGTIASDHSPLGLSPQLTGKDILRYVPELRSLAKISTLDLMSLDSTNLNPSHWQKISAALGENYKDYDGFVISHGTDTLTWTAAALSLMLENLGKPVVLVASQLTLMEDNSDAPDNLITAFTMASADYQGVYAVCNATVFSGLWFYKIASENLQGFIPTNAPVIATYEEDSQDPFAIPQLHWHHQPPLKNNGNLTIIKDLETKIANIFLTPLTTAQDILNLGNNYAGFVVHAYGAGGIPSDPSNDVLTALGALAKNKPVICITQCKEDGVHLHRYAVGQKALAANIISAGKLAVEGATVLLMKCLGQNLSIEEIKTEFEKY